MAQEFGSSLKDQGWVQTITAQFKSGAHPGAPIFVLVHQNMAVNDMNVAGECGSGDLHEKNVCCCSQSQCYCRSFPDILCACKKGGPILPQQFPIKLLQISRKSIGEVVPVFVQCESGHPTEPLLLGDRPLVPRESLQTTPQSTGTTCAHVAPPLLVYVLLFIASKVERNNSQI